MNGDPERENRRDAEEYLEKGLPKTMIIVYNIKVYENKQHD